MNLTYRPECLHLLTASWKTWQQAVLAELLSSINKEKDSNFAWRITQGVEMGRPSFLKARTEKKEDEVTGDA